MNSATTPPYAAGMALTAAEIPCCLCGTLILPNAANQCATCLAQDVDLKARLQRGPGGADKIVVHQCRECRRFSQTDKHYIYAEPESPELLAICLKRIPALNGSSGGHSSNGGNYGAPIHLVDAGWIWTEPHSMRFKVRLTVRAEVQNVPVQQRVMVELHNQFQQCPDCNREYTNRTWHARVQIRQHRTHNKKGLAALEMALRKHSIIRKHVLKMDLAKDGFDFYFLTLPQAQSMAQYLAKITPMRIKTSQKLVSENVNNNTANLKHTVMCDMVPLCRDDLMVIHKKASGGRLAGRLAIVTQVASAIRMIDASPKRERLSDSQMELGPETYYKNEKYYQVLQASDRMVRFTVLDVELCEPGNSHHAADEGSDALHKGPASGVTKYALADVQVVRESDDEMKDILHCVTHLGHLVRPGDTVLGYDLSGAVVGNDDWEDTLNNSYVIPDVVLVKKVAGGQVVAETEEEGGKPKTTKKRERRRRRKEGKKSRELEESAVRMGFFEGDESMQGEVDADVAHDAELAEELQALEEQLAALEVPEEEAESQGLVEDRQVDPEVGANSTNNEDESTR